MKTKKIWGFIALLAFAFATSFTVISCGDDDDDNGASGSGTETGTNTGTNSGTGSGDAGASADNIVGTYYAITSAENKIMVQFGKDGSGLITERYNNSSTGKVEVDQDNFTYTMSGNTGILRKSNNYGSGDNGYTIRFVDGFMLVEEADGDIEFILYREGANLGKADNSKFVGTWYFKDSYSETEVVTKSDGTGIMKSMYQSGSYVDKYEDPFTYKALNAYVAEATAIIEGYKETYYCAVLGGKLYLIEDDGEVDYDQILSKK
ncbi:MAG: hypothetical protein KBT29_08945 [Prevotellaceae bacterium]|nr:hypothetical protein [Candidatus Minthosoma caballi]